MACYISEKLSDEEKGFIYTKVCIQPCYDEANLFLHSDEHKYCLLHLPNNHKPLEEFWRIIKKRIDEGNLDFSGVYFPEKFYCTTKMYGVFESDVDFKFASFPKGAFFANEFKGEVNFWKTYFGDDVEFGETIFRKGARFSKSVFEGNLTFYSISLSDKSTLNLGEITTSPKSKVYFTSQRSLEGTIFVDGTFLRGSLEFNRTWDKKTLEKEDFQFSITGIFESPERVLFRNLPLNPLFFIGTDSRKFTFEKVKWSDYPKKPDEDFIRNYRKLAENAENNNRFEEASNFRRMAFECERLENPWWKQPFTLNWWYWLTSSYGESWRYAFYFLVWIVLGFFPIIYGFYVQFQVCPKEKPILMTLQKCEIDKSNCECSDRSLNFYEAISHSLSTATLQTVEYRITKTFWGGLWIILEKVFAPLQAALLALAIRRKFMR